MPPTSVPLPERAISVKQQIEAFGFPWTYEPEYRLPEPEKVQRAQVRNVGSYAPREEVKKYQAAMKRGDQFPPGVVTRDGRFVDFNTRAIAAYKSNLRYFPAFVLDVDYAASPEHDRHLVDLLGAAFNMKSSRRLTRDELIDRIRQAAEDPNFSAERVATLLGLSESLAKQVFAQMRAEKRAARLGVKLNGSVTASNRVVLGSRTELNDDVFRELCRLTVDSRMTGQELRQLVGRLKELGSDSEKLSAIADERRARDAQIQHVQVYGKQRPPLAVEMRRRLGFILEHGHQINALVDYNPTTREDYLTKVAEAATVLAELRDEQRSHNLHATATV